MRARDAKTPARGRKHGQAIVEFGLVALLFTLLLMGIVDFAVLLNGWLGVSSNARDLARQVAVGMCPAGFTCGGAPNLPSATSLAIQGVDRSPTTGQAIAVTIKDCVPGSSASCTARTAAQVSNAYGGTCTSSCTYPAVNDSLVLTVQAQIQVVTPLVRPFFGCSGWFIDQRGKSTNASNPKCDVTITSQSVVRYEGAWI